MAEIELKKFNGRDQHSGNDDEPEQKRPKPDGCENDANAVETKTITNIYYDCLERIFDFLDIESLLMVANTCKRLQIAAAAKFGDEYGNKRVILDLQGGEGSSVHLYSANEISVTGLKFCLPFLRCFGGKITELAACYLVQPSKHEHLDQYINQYCADNLTDIFFAFKSEFPKEAFQKPFKHVELVSLMQCHLSWESLSNFITWLPNMRRLNMFACTIDDTASTNVQFPYLRDLVLFLGSNDRNILQSNPQLQSLEIVSVFEMALDTLLTEIHGNSTITKLKVEFKVTIDVDLDVNANELERFVAEHPLMVELVLKQYRLTADDAINFIRQMKALEQIGFLVRGRAECDRIIKELEGEWKSAVVTNDGKFYVELNR